METLVPNRYLARFEFPLLYHRPGLKIDGDVTKWPDRYLLPDIGQLDEEENWAPVWMAWNEEGLYIACLVDEKEHPPKCNPSAFWKSDNLRLMTDMRDTRTIKRASRFCQQFFFMPTGGGGDGKHAVAGAAKIHRAQVDAPLARPGDLRVASKVTDDAWALEAFIPASVLAGFDPAEHRRIGLYYMLEDSEWGQQYLTVGDDLRWWVDPSTWPTAVLAE
jgi:hypothetical protein